MTHRRPTTGVLSNPTTGKIFYITSYIATNPLRSIQVTLRSIRLCFVRFGFGWLVTLRFIKFHALRRQHLPACYGISSVPTNATSPLNRCYLPTYLAVPRLIHSIQPSLTSPLVPSACVNADATIGDVCTFLVICTLQADKVGTNYYYSREVPDIYDSGRPVPCRYSVLSTRPLLVFDIRTIDA